MQPSTSYSIHFFTQLLSSFRNTCTYHRNLFCYTHTHLFNGPLSWTTRVSRYQKCKTNLDFTEAKDSEWQWQQLGHMQVCTALHTDNHASTPPLSFLQAGCPSCRPTNSIKALKPTTCFAKVPKLWHLFIISLSTHHLVICLLP